MLEVVLVAASLILVVECDCWEVCTSAVAAVVAVVVVVVASAPLPLVFGTTSGVLVNFNADAVLLSSPLPLPLLLLLLLLPLQSSIKSAIECAASSHNNHVPLHNSTQLVAIPYNKTNRLALIYRLRDIIEDDASGGGSRRTNVLVPLYDGLKMYCCKARREEPETREARPDLRRSLGYKM
jgi:hypothetical protein